jgi:hypothetical protein
MISRVLICIPIFLFSFFSRSQSWKLSDELKEISGLEFLNDSILIAHNDGGNPTELFLLNLKGEIIKKVSVSNVKNVDWEDITSDDEFIYIGDIGNNLNKRKDLKIYRIEKSDLMEKETVNAKSMQISYADQLAFPPDDVHKTFDSECLIAALGDLWIFSKNRTVPFDGICKVYRFKFEAGNEKQISVFTQITIGNSGWQFDSVTAGDFENNKFYLSTYNRWISYELKNNSLEQLHKKNYSEYNQKEALVIDSKSNSLFVANEFNKLLGKQKLKKIKLK